MIVVTGAAGFIGSAFVWKCNTEGIRDLLLVDSLKHSDKWKNLVGLDYLEFVQKDDFLDMIIDESMPENVTAIVHMGACSATTETDGDYLLTNNYRYSQLLLEWCIKSDVRFIYASSAATYGDGANGFSDEDALECLRPINRYGYSKHLFDRYVKRLGVDDKVVGLKFFNVFGPNEYHKESMRSVICKSYQHILDHGDIRLFKSHRTDYSDGEQARDFVYVKDCVSVIFWLMTRPDVNGLFNVGTGQARTWNDVAHALFAAMNKPPNIHYVDMPQDIQSHYQYFTQASITKLTAAGYDGGFMTLEDATLDYVRSYLLDHSYLDSLKTD